MQNYNFLQRFLHDIILGNKFIRKSLYELEKSIFLKKTSITNIKDEKHIFVTGLPRSGTTTLLNFIYSSNNFASLKYLNMPFVMAPNISRLFKKKNIALRERYHQDGIMFDLDSPEAFDEVFFSTFDNSFIRDELLNYFNLILLSENKKRYLSKNNLNYKRINFILSILPKSLFLIPIREPLQHSYSLLNQHLHFLKLQKQNNFIKRYINYLGHNEFGINHASWNRPIKYSDYKSINYWLEQWILFYESIYEKYKKNSNCKFIIYEKLVDKNSINELLKFADLKTSNDFTFLCNNKSISLNCDKKLYQEAKNTYAKFIEL